MRLEWAVIVGCCLVSAWLFYDEEPILDLTDLGFIQSLCMLFAMLSVFWENMGRIGAGFYVSRDRQLGLWTLTFFIGQDLYFKLVACVFFLHSMVPLWVDQVETTSLYAFVLGSYWVLALQLMGFLTLALALVYSTERIPLWAPLFILVAGGWGWSLGDTLVSGLTSSSSKSAADRITPYGFTPSSCTYEPRLGGGQFEWHATTVYPNSFFFIDFSSTMYSLLMVITIAVLLYLLGVGMVGYYLGGYTWISYTHRAVIIRLLEHGLVGLCGGIFMIVGLGFRVGFEHYAVGA